MNVLDGIREGIRINKLRQVKRDEEAMRLKANDSFNSDVAIPSMVIRVLKEKNVITAGKADEYTKLYQYTDLQWKDFLKSMMEEIANKNVRVFYWGKPFDIRSNNLIPYCFVEIGPEKLFNEYKKYFEKLETRNYGIIVIADYKALLLAMKSECQEKIAKRDAEAKALRKKYEEEIAFYEQIRQAKAKYNEVNAKEYNNEHPNLLCRAAISSADKELSKL